MTTLPDELRRLAGEELTALADQCRTCAQFYQDHPGGFGPAAAVDLYFTIARVADAMLRLEAQEKPE